MSGHLKLVRRPKSTAKAKAGTEIAISEIVIGERYRRDMGDIAGLAASIADIGLINPIEKPDEFLAFVEALCPAPRYAYLFARNFDGDRWDGRGDEV